MCIRDRYSILIFPLLFLSLIVNFTPSLRLSSFSNIAVSASFSLIFFLISGSSIFLSRSSLLNKLSTYLTGFIPDRIRFCEQFKRKNKNVSGGNSSFS